MNCLSQRKKFKNKHPVWLDSSDVKEKDGTIHITEKDLESDHEEEESESSDDDHDMYANDVRSKKISLETKDLQYKHLVNLNNERSFKGGVEQVQFNPKSKIALIGLKSGQVDLFEVDGERNRYIQNIKLPYTKSPRCSFMSDGDSIVIASKTYKGKFYSYDMNSGLVREYFLKSGTDSIGFNDFTLFDDHMACRKDDSQEVSILSSKTFENTFSFRVNEAVRAIQFTNSNELFVVGENAGVYIWDLRKTSICKHRFQDEGTVHANSLAISKTSNLLSIGSELGVVNCYELEKCKSERFPSPIKSYKNLKTPVDILKYNSTGELLLMASSTEQKAFRLIHSLSHTVYKNFPLPRKEYGYLFSADFSPLSGYLALGCSTGRAHLCRIPYYKSY